MTIDDSRPSPNHTVPQADTAPQAGPAPPSDELDGARARLAEMRRDFSPATYAAILAAFASDLGGVAEGLCATTGDALARHGHVLTALAGELGQLPLSARGRAIETHRDPAFAAETATLIAPLLALLRAEEAL